MREVSFEEHQRDAIKNMTAMDRLPADVRGLINEFGFSIVRAMWNDGHRNAAKLREELETWRERQQEKRLSQIPYAPRSSPALPRA